MNPATVISDGIRLTVLDDNTFYFPEEKESGVKRVKRASATGGNA